MIIIILTWPLLTSIYIITVNNKLLLINCFRQLSVPAVFTSVLERPDHRQPRASHERELRVSFSGANCLSGVFDKQCKLWRTCCQVSSISNASFEKRVVRWINWSASSFRSWRFSHFGSSKRFILNIPLIIQLLERSCPLEIIFRADKDPVRKHFDAVVTLNESLNFKAAKIAEWFNYSLFVCRNTCGQNRNPPKSFSACKPLIAALCIMQHRC